MDHNHDDDHGDDNNGVKMTIMRIGTVMMMRERVMNDDGSFRIKSMMMTTMVDSYNKVQL